MNSNILNQYNIKKTGVIHIGAHVAEEIEEYIDLGIKNVIYIEANPEIINKLMMKLTSYMDKINIDVYNIAISNSKRSKPFYVTGNNMSSSLYALNHESIKDGLILKKTQQVKCDTLDNFISSRNINMDNYNLLNMDTQGSEYDILTKADKTLKHIDYIQAETFKNEDYINIKLHDDVIKLLETKGFKMVHYDKGVAIETGDCHFIKEKIYE